MISKIDVGVGGKASGWQFQEEQVPGLLLEMCAAWLHLCFDVALFFKKVTKNLLQTRSPFYTSREVPC